jgi:hypothetical protein
MSTKRFVAVACSHGPHLSRSVERELFRFLSNYKPHLRIHLGDVWDTTCWRAGAGNTRDEGADIDEDFNAGANFLRRFEPNIVFLGNHDARPYRSLTHPKAIVRKAAKLCVAEMESLIQDELHANLVEYHIRKGWRMIGDAAVGQG